MAGSAIVNLPPSPAISPRPTAAAGPRGTTPRPLASEPPTEFRIFYWPEAIAEWVQVGDSIPAESAQEAIAKLSPQAVGSYRVCQVGKPDRHTTFCLALEASRPAVWRCSEWRQGLMLSVRALLDEWMARARTPKARRLT